jgi:CheY-like chemotaxis protein
MVRNTPAGAVRSVLYVEDQPVNAMLMGALFEKRPGLRLVLASTGQQALCIAARLNPALLLLDMGLPDCHGSQLLPLLRHLPGCDTAPAVAVTAEEDFLLPGSGFIELWPKPLNLQHVLSRLDALTGSSGAPLSGSRVLQPAIDASAQLRAAPSAITRWTM